MTARWLVVLAACTKHGAPAAQHDAGAAAARDGAVAAVAPADAAPPPAPPVPAKLVVGPQTSCAVMTDRTLRCWPGTATIALRGVLDVAIGDAHACALLDDGSLACWGKIGFGSATPLAVPTAVPGVNDAKRVFALGGAACAGEASGALTCWGDVDAAGHVTATGAHRAPTAARGLSHVAALTPHGALLEGGDVVMADGKHTGTTNVVELAADGDFTCGRTDDNAVECFGAAQPCVHDVPKPVAKPAKPKSKHGKPARPVKPPPKPSAVRTEPIAGLTPAAHLAFDAGLCVVTPVKHLLCRDATAAGCPALRPPPIANIVETAGHCARLGDGTVACWDGSAVSVMRGVTHATQLAASGDHACALLADHSIACWARGRAPAPIAY